MSNKPNNVSPALQERLVLLIEECSEVIQAATKILRFGPVDKHPNKLGGNNSADLAEELGHLWLAMEMLVHQGDIPNADIVRAMYFKAHTLDTYMKHQPLGMMKELRDRFTVQDNKDE